MVHKTKKTKLFEFIKRKKKEDEEGQKNPLEDWLKGRYVVLVER